MISEKHSQAARANGARSRGPVTPEGKAISSRNAMRHGLLAKTVLLSNEDPAVFKQLFYMMIERFSPLDDVEMSMIEDMTAACWRLHRAMAMEKSILEAGIAARPNIPPIEQIAGSFSDSVNALDLDRLLRHQTRLQNIYQRALRGLAQLRKMARPEGTADLPNEPSAPIVCNAASKHPVPIQPKDPPVSPPQPSSRSDGGLIPPPDLDFTPEIPFVLLK